MWEFKQFKYIEAGPPVFRFLRRQLNLRVNPVLLYPHKNPRERITGQNNNSFTVSPGRLEYAVFLIAVVPVVLNQHPVKGSFPAPAYKRYAVPYSAVPCSLKNPQHKDRVFEHNRSI
jgi:hypothetical protein